MRLEQYCLVMVQLPNSKAGPAVILSPSTMNRDIDTIIIAPITRKGVKHYKFRVPIKIDDQKGYIAPDQIRAVSKSRIIKEDVSLSRLEIEELKTAIQQLLLA